MTTKSTEDYEKLHLLQIPALLPELFSRSMQRHFEMSFRSIPHHLCEGERGVLCPGDSIFACFQRPAKVSDKSVRSILARVDGPAAKIYTWNIAAEFQKIRTLD